MSQQVLHRGQRIGRLLTTDPTTVPEAALLERAAWFLASYPEFDCVGLDPRNLSGGAEYREKNRGIESDLRAASAFVVRPEHLRDENSFTEFATAILPKLNTALIRPYAPWSFLGVNRPTKRTGDYQILEREFQLTRPIPPQRHITMLAPFLKMGGAEKFDLDLIRELKKLGWKITLLTTTPDTHSWVEQFADEVDELFVLYSFLREAKFAEFIQHIINSRGSELVFVTHSHTAYALLPYLRAVCPQVAFVDYCHIAELFWENGGYPRQSLKWARYLDLQIVSSEALKQWMCEQGGDPQQIEVAYTAADTESIRPDMGVRAAVRSGAGFSDTQVVALFAGRIVQQKQPLVLVRALVETCRVNPNFVALVAGDGPDMPTLQREVAVSGFADRIRLLGEQPNESVKTLMAAADIFFLPSENEGISLAIYEAMAAGLAVVGADVGGQRELVSADTGVLLPRADCETEIEQYAQVLTALSFEPERCRQMGKAARKRVETQFPLTALGPRIVQLFQLACSRKRSKLITLDAAEQYLKLSMQYQALGRMGHELSENAVGLGSQIKSEGEKLLKLRQEKCEGPLAQEEYAERVQRVQNLISEKDALWEKIVSIP